jgi:hypothetical protein
MSVLIPETARFAFPGARIQVVVDFRIATLIHPQLRHGSADQGVIIGATPQAQTAVDMMNSSPQIVQHIARVPAIAGFAEDPPPALDDRVAPDNDSAGDLARNTCCFLTGQSADQVHRRLAVQRSGFRARVRYNDLKLVTRFRQ